MRSITHPAEVDREGSLFVVRDAPRRKGPERTREIVVVDIPPEMAREEVIRLGAGHKHSVCVLTNDISPHRPTIDAYKSFGYRFLRTEPMFVHDMKEIAEPDPGIQICRVQTITEAERWAKAAGARQIDPKHLSSDPLLVRGYVAEASGQIVGYVRSIQLCHPDTFVAGLFVSPSHRRMGIGRALMLHMLKDDRQHGIECSTLLASASGSKLYPKVGYRQIGILHLFVPAPMKPR
jgi:ribosomal protein S18 acetylase RimI-like enzyme